MNNITETLMHRGIGIIASGTLYGIVGQALNHNAVQRIYAVKQRTPTKPFIILIHDISDLALFNVVVTQTMQESLKTYWPGPVSIILECNDPSFEYLHRDTDSLAFRMPAKPEVQEILKFTGPLVAPSANPEGMPPAHDIAAARNYFGDSVDFYSEGSVNDKASKIIKITGRGIEVIRP